MAKKTVEKEVSLESILWNCRNALRGVGSTEKNRDAVMGLTFLKFAGDKFEKKRKEIIEKYGDISAFLEKKSFYRSDNIFYLKETSRWSYIVKNASANDIAIILDNAMYDIEEENEPLNGALPQKLYATLGSKETIKSLIDEVNKIDEKRFHEEDLIGRVYEYFLQAYAVSGKKEDGEFYTPACIVELITELIEPYSGVVYDPCCGSGGMFVQSHKFVKNHHGNNKMISVVGQESQPETWRLCKMNLAIRGISHDLGRTNASTFTNDQHKDKKVDFIMANPPFNLKAWRKSNELTTDARWDGYATPRESNANYAWILHMISKLDVTNGIAGFLLANGALNDSDELAIRTKMIENDKVEAIIVLPRDMFYSTDISVTLWIINNNKRARTLNGRKLRDRQNEVLFVDLRRWDTNVEEYTIDKKSKKKKTVFTFEQIAKVKEIYNTWQNEDTTLYSDVPELCKSVKTMRKYKTNDDEITIEDNKFSLAPSKYIEFIDHDLEIDYEKEMARIQEEMKEVLKTEKASQSMLEKAFRGIGYGID